MSICKKHEVSNKKTLPICLFFITCSNSVYSQSKFQFGLAASIDVNAFPDFKRTDLRQSFKISPGYSIGITSRYRLKDKLVFNSGVLFTQKKYTPAVDFSLGILEEINQNSIEVPLALSFILGNPNRTWTPYIFGGLDFQADLSVKATFSNLKTTLPNRFVAVEEIVALMPNSGIGVMAKNHQLQLKYRFFRCDCEYQYRLLDKFSLDYSYYF